MSHETDGRDRIGGSGPFQICLNVHGMPNKHNRSIRQSAAWISRRQGQIGGMWWRDSRRASEELPRLRECKHFQPAGLFLLGQEEAYMGLCAIRAQFSGIQARFGEVPEALTPVTSSDMCMLGNEHPAEAGIECLCGDHGRVEGGIVATYYRRQRGTWNRRLRPGGEFSRKLVSSTVQSPGRSLFLP